MRKQHWPNCQSHPIHPPPIADRTLTTPVPLSSPLAHFPKPQTRAALPSRHPSLVLTASDLGFPHPPQRLLMQPTNLWYRHAGGVGWARDDYVEYDLDNEDEDWLEAFNGGPPGSTGVPRLAEDKFEAMLYRLEVSNAEANQHLMGDSGGQGLPWGSAAVGLWGQGGCWGPSCRKLLEVHQRGAGDA